MRVCIVCIVGAGVAGLQSAKVLMLDGHECHVFEKLTFSIHEI